MRRGVRQMHSNHKDNDERTAADLIGLHKTHSARQREASQARGNDALNDYTNRLGRHRR